MLIVTYHLRTFSVGARAKGKQNFMNHNDLCAEAASLVAACGCFVAKETRLAKLCRAEKILACLWADSVEHRVRVSMMRQRIGELWSL